MAVLVATLLALLTSVSTRQVAALEEHSAGKGATSGKFIVVSVDPSTDTLVLEQAQVGTLQLRAEPRVSLSRLVPGQEVEVSYYPEVALALRGAPLHSDDASLRRLVAGRPTLTHRVVAVDTLGHTVTVRASSGPTHVIHVTNLGIQDSSNRFVRETNCA